MNNIKVLVVEKSTEQYKAAQVIVNRLRGYTVDVAADGKKRSNFLAPIDVMQPFLYRLRKMGCRFYQYEINYIGCFVSTL